MTQNKDQKRLIRARMQKTGEAYTAARAVIVQRGASAPTYAAAKSEWAALAGVADASVAAKTERTWAQWVAALDAAGAHAMSHRDIAKHVRDTYEVSGWWSQTITVGYERIRGLREVGQRRDGAYAANKSRTFATDVSSLYLMFKDGRRRKRWLGEGVTKVRTAVEDRSIRFDWHDGTQVNLYFDAKGPNKSTVSVQHTKLPDPERVAEAKELWQGHLDALKEALRA